MFDGTDFYAGVEQFRNIEDAVGTGGFNGVTVKFGVVFPETKSAFWFEDGFDAIDNVAGSDGAWIGDIISAKGCAIFPEVERGADEITAMGERIYVVVNL